MKLLYPLKGTIKINQGFGANSAYYAKFRDRFGEPDQGHPGIDFFADLGTPVYASHDGVALYEVDSHGGEGVTISSPLTDFNGQQVHFVTKYWHFANPHIYPQFASPLFGQKAVQVKAGDLIGYADNSGAPYESSGNHLHFGLALEDVNMDLLYPHNGFDGNVDPTPFFSDKFLFLKDLSFGMGMINPDPDVFQLQERLVSQGLADFTPNGAFGPKTKAAVIAYQKKYGINPTGYVGPITRGRLNL